MGILTIYLDRGEYHYLLFFPIQRHANIHRHTFNLLTAFSFVCYQRVPKLHIIFVSSVNSNKSPYRKSKPPTLRTRTPLGRAIRTLSLSWNRTTRLRIKIMERWSRPPSQTNSILFTKRLWVYCVSLLRCMHDVCSNINFLMFLRINHPHIHPSTLALV